MYFNSINFYVFFLIVFIFYWKSNNKVKKYLILLLSVIYYLSFDVKLPFILLLLSILNYYISNKIYKSDSVEKSKIKKAYMISGIIINVFFLFFYKYLIEILTNFSALIKSSTVIDSAYSMNFGVHIGLSYYTLSSISYIVDVYKDSRNFEKNIVLFLVYLFYFPKIVEGPIENSKIFIEEIKNINKVEYKKIYIGFLQILWGLFLKIIIADRLSIYINTIFYGDIYSYSGLYLLINILLYSIQIYCDFCGYTTIAIGISKMLNIELSKNFSSPFFSTSISELWNRWHISLSNWLKKYIYIPLGGNRKGIRKQCINILIVFLVSGIWHGITFNYILWGLFNGFFVVLDTVIEKYKQSNKKYSLKIARRIGVYLIFSFGMIFFRFSNLHNVLSIIKSILFKTNFNYLSIKEIEYFAFKIEDVILLAIAILVVFIVDYFKYIGVDLNQKIVSKGYVFKSIFVIIFVCVILVFGKYGPLFDEASYIYANF